jgi:hypothetical protein
VTFPISLNPAVDLLMLAQHLFPQFGFGRAELFNDICIQMAGPSLSQRPIASSGLPDVPNLRVMSTRYPTIGYASLEQVKTNKLIPFPWRLRNRRSSPVKRGDSRLGGRRRGLR